MRALPRWCPLRTVRRRLLINDQFGVNFMGAVQTARAFLPYINEGGTILFITTFLTQVGFPGLSVYNASKAALKSLAQTLAAELAPQKIRVNSIGRGYFRTSENCLLVGGLWLVYACRNDAEPGDIRASARYPG